MAVTSIWRVKGWLGKVVLYIENPEKTQDPDFYQREGLTGQERESLADVIAYAVNQEKTEDWGDDTLADEHEQVLQQYVSGINCAMSTARMEMMAVKKRFGKEDGVIAYHGYQSFAPGECTPAMTHEIGVRLAQELWGERYQVLIATHLDKANHLHNHFVVNTVSFLDGRKYHRTKQDYRDMRRISDRLCREYGLSVIGQSERRRGKSYGEWRAEQEDRPTYAGMMKADVDEAIQKARTEKQFFYYLREKGYSFKFGKDITLRAAGRDRGLKLARNLGEDYTIDAIRERILRQKTFLQENRERHDSRFVDSKDRNPVTVLRVYVGARPKRKIGGLRGLYLHYCYLLGILPKKKSPVQPGQVQVLLREELLKLHTIAEETRLLCQYKIDTAEQLLQVQGELEYEKERMIGERRHLQYQCRSIRDPERMAQVKREIKELNGKIGENRRKIKLCQGIGERSYQMREKIRIVHQENNREKEGNIMGRKATTITLTPEERSYLELQTRSRTIQAQTVCRTRILLLKADGEPINVIADKAGINRCSVMLCLKKFREGGFENALSDAPGRGRNPEITDDEKTWIINIACQKPVDLGYSAEVWTRALLTKHIHQFAEEAGYLRLSTISQSKVRTILEEAEIKPNKITYYCENRDPYFDQKMHNVLLVYKQLSLQFDENGQLLPFPEEGPVTHVLSYGEKPGIQAIANTTEDLPRDENHKTISRDYEYKRLGTVSLLAGIDLQTGEAIPLVRDRHSSKDI